mgnify:FL=1
MKTFSPLYRDAKKAHVPNLDVYREMYNKSVNDPDAFWAEQAEKITWYEKWNKVSDVDFHNANIKWFEGGKLKDRKSVV